MVNRLLAVDENNQLPAAVQEQLVGPVRTEFQTLTNTATLAASVASSAEISAVAAKNAAEAAAASATLPTDGAVEALIVDETSATHTALNARYLSTANIVTATPTARVFFVDRGTYVAQVTIVDTGGRFVGGIVGKEFAGNLQNTGATGTAFKPIRENLRDYLPLSTMPIRSNSSGWRVTGNAGTDANNINEIIGLQIRNGVLIHDFDNLAGDALGFRADGTSKIYRSSSWTGAQVVADGVVMSYAFGPALVDAGVKATIVGTERSARTLLGQRIDGTILMVHIPGATGSWGATIPECATFMAETLAAYNAINLDGGGSSQLMVENTVAQPSSDVGGLRPIPDILTINARITASVETPWTALPLLSGFTAAETDRLPQYRRVNGRIELRGRVTGLLTEKAYNPVATLPNYLVSPHSNTVAGIGAVGTVCIATIPANTLQLLIYPLLGIGWFDLGGIEYSQV